MNNFDIIVLIEIKCCYAFSVPGFEVLRSSNRALRGGVAVLVKGYLWPDVYEVQSLCDQVWFKLSFLPDVRIGACYIPPSDSSYFSPASFSEVQEQVIDSDNRILVIGDFNSRMPLLQKLNNAAKDIRYSANVDQGENAHGRELLNMCLNLDIYPVNHLNYGEKHFAGNKTYRKRDNWISQLDWLLVSSSLLHLVTDFTVEHHSPLLCDHAALSVGIACPPPMLDVTWERAKLLGTYPENSRKAIGCRAVPINSLCPEGFNAALPDPTSWWRQLCDGAAGEPPSVDELCDRLTDLIYSACQTAKLSDRHIRVNGNGTANDAQSRWQILLDKKDPKAIWASINWKGQITHQKGDKSKPSDEAFCRHFEKLLNPVPDGEVLTVPHTDMYVPILDDPITVREIRDVIARLRRDKAAGIDGIPPGVLKFLDGEWLNVLASLFNMTFEETYPEQWAIAKVFTVFKKGNANDTNNYRGISIQTALAKVYDGILRNRFELWFQPDDEQAGGVAGRGCAEQLFTLRLLIDYCQKTRKTLYIAFIDYIKAYDKLDRNLLLRKLTDQGCGKKYLAALANSLKNSKNALGSEIFASSAGVKQGAANSCSLFTFYVNSTIKALKSFGNDEYLENFHSLLFMDDTVVLATSRNAMQQKLRLLNQEAQSIRMEIHPSKSRYMVINGTDYRSFSLNNITIDHTDEYIYLGTPVMNVSLAKQVKAHIEQRQSHLLKFRSFLRKNSDAPFSIKELVLKSALSSALLYGCESWLCNDVRAAVAPILSAQKQLLSVRNQTCNDLVQAELGYPGASAIIKETQSKFMAKLTSRDNYIGSPAHFVINLARQAGTQCAQYIDSLLQREPGYFGATSSEALKSKITESVSSRRKTYCDFNPGFTRHRMYRENIPEHLRVALTRIRLGSHRLKVETGRWSRIPVEQRLCTCGEVQTEQHVLLSCPLSEPIRETFRNLNFTDPSILMEGNVSDLALYCYRVLAKFEDSQ